MTILAAILLDRAGRRPLLLTGLAGMVVGLGMLGVSFAPPTLSAFLGRGALLSVAVYVAGFAIGLGPVFWLRTLEHIEAHWRAGRHPRAM